MNHEEYRRFWEFYGVFILEGSQRRGQAMMNALRYAAYELYDMITGTEADCFYQDSKIPEFKRVLDLP